MPGSCSRQSAEHSAQHTAGDSEAATAVVIGRTSPTEHHGQQHVPRHLQVTSVEISRQRPGQRAVHRPGVGVEAGRHAPALQRLKPQTPRDALHVLQADLD